MASTKNRRDSSKARMLSRVQRYRALLLKLWWVPFLTVLIALGLQAALIKMSPPLYTSVGRMIVSIKLAIPEGSVYTEEMTSFLGTQTALMQSGVVISRARTRLGAENAAWKSQSASLRVNVVPRTSIFILQATSDNAQYAQAFLQACMDEYIQVKKEMRNQASDTTVAGLAEEVMRLEKEIRKSDDELAAFQSTNSVEVFQGQGSGALTVLQGLKQRLLACTAELDNLDLQTTEQNLQRQVLLGSDQAAFSEITAGQEYMRARQQMVLLEAELEDTLQYLKPNHPKILAIQDEIRRKEHVLKLYLREGEREIAKRKATITLQITKLKEDISQWDSKALEFTRLGSEFERLKANSQRLQALYSRLMSSMQTLDVNKEVSPESVTVMETASPAYPDLPDLVSNLVKAGIIGLLAGLAILGLIDHFDDRMGSFTEFQDHFDEEVLSQIPRERPESRKEGPRLIQENDGRHAYVESFRTARSSLMFMNPLGTGLKTILVTSSLPNDGKSLTASNLAITMAMGGSRVLLVDADVRKGLLHHRFRVANEQGLAEVLASEADWKQVAQATSYKGLDILPRGHTTGGMGDLFIGEEPRQVLQALREAYDIIIIDSAPVMAADDVTSLAPIVDGVIFVVRSEQTSARVAQAALGLLYQRRVKVLGVIFNAVRPRSSDYYYYYNYKDYYHASTEAKKLEPETKQVAA